MGRHFALDFLSSISKFFKYIIPNLNLCLGRPFYRSAAIVLTTGCQNSTGRKAEGGSKAKQKCEWHQPAGDKDKVSGMEIDKWMKVLSSRYK